MYQSPFYENYVSNPYASQFGVSSRYPLPSAAAQIGAQQAAAAQPAGKVWICTSSPCSCGQVTCHPVQWYCGCCCRC